MRVAQGDEILFVIDRDGQSFFLVLGRESEVEIRIRDQFESDGYEATSVRVRIGHEDIHNVARSVEAGLGETDRGIGIHSSDGYFGVRTTARGAVFVVDTGPVTVSWPVTDDELSSFVCALRE